ncbi:MAG: class I SAM-dependent methyltransferase [Hyphomicrobiaceae bacterium]
MAIEESLIEAFFDRIPEARRIADKMMHGREVKTKVADRERFFSYFDLISPILNAKPGSTRYLDIGCGVGHSVELGKELGFNALGLEVSRTALATARHSDRNVQHPGDWQGKETFDLISLFETLEHVTRPDSLMAQARQCLAPGGLLLITVPNVQCWEIQLLRERCFHVFGGFEGVGHINLFSPEGLSRLFERHGLCLVHADGQFSNNPLDIAGRLLDQRASATAAFAKGTLASSLPRELHTILNALGPDLAVLDRANLRSPILIAVACRKEDVEQLAPSIEQLRQARSRDLMGALSKPRPPATPAAVPPPPEPILPPAPLFTAHTPIAGFLNADTERLLGARGFTSSVASGLSLRSAEPLRFQRMATLGSGKLAAGTYEIAAQLKLRRGLITLSLFDDAKQAWATNLAIEPNDTEVRTTFTLAADSDVTLYVCAHNSDAPRPVDVDIFALGIAALDATARLILPPPPPEPIHVLSPAPLFTAHAPIAGFLNADTERLLGARGFTDSVVSGLSLRSAEPLRFQRMATLGSGKLAAGTYEIAAQLKLRRGLVTLSLFDDAKQAWVTNLAVEPNDTEVRATFTLAADSDVTLYACAHNSEAPRPVDVDIFALGIAALDATARLIPQPPAPPIARVRAPIDLFASLPDGKPLKGFLLPAFAALAPRDRVSGGLEHGLSFRSAAPLRFEYLAEIANGKLAKGRYGLAAAAHVFEGHLSLNLLDQTRGQWTTSISFDADRYSGAVTFELEADTTCKLYLCANNSDAPAPVHIDLHAIGLAALGEGHLIVDAPTPPPTTTTALAKQPVRSSRRLLASFRELASGLPLGSSSLAKPLPDGPGRIRRRAATLAIGKTSALREYLHKGAEIALQEGHYALRIAGRVDAGALAIGLLDVDRDAWIINVGLSIGECWSERVFDIPAPLHALLIVSGNNADTGPISAEITAIDLHAILGPDA